MDLSKLKALELPTEEIEVEILGEKQKVKISAYDDAVQSDMADIDENFKTDSERRLRRHLLTYCANLNEEDADLLISRDNHAVSAIVNGIFDLRDRFVKARNEMREKARKNSKGGNLPDTKG
jgi:hypothetical protein